MRAVRTRIGLAVATMALVAAGCGGDDEEAEPLTTEEFITKGRPGGAPPDA